MIAHWTVRTWDGGNYFSEAWKERYTTVARDTRHMRSFPNVASCAHVDGAEALTHCVFPVLLCVIAVFGRKKKFGK